MSLADDLASAPRGHAKGCTVRRILRRLDPADRAALEASLADEDVDGAFIAARLRHNNQWIADYTIQRHRRGACTCGRVA